MKVGMRCLRFMGLTGVFIGIIAVHAPVVSANDQSGATEIYPPGWNIKSDVPPPQSRFLPGTDTNTRSANNPSRYGPDSCHWDWCTAPGKASVTATEKNLQRESGDRAGSSQQH
jgi:hypothetical protein